MRLLFREAVVLNDPSNCILGVGVGTSAEAKRWGGPVGWGIPQQMPPAPS